MTKFLLQLLMNETFFSSILSPFFLLIYVSDYVNVYFSPENRMEKFLLCVLSLLQMNAIQNTFNNSRTIFMLQVTSHSNDECPKMIKCFKLWVKKYKNSTNLSWSECFWKQAALTTTEKQFFSNIYNSDSCGLIKTSRTLNILLLLIAVIVVSPHTSQLLPTTLFVFVRWCCVEYQHNQITLFPP
jgi:hypothetical protein